MLVKWGVRTFLMFTTGFLVLTFYAFDPSTVLAQVVDPSIKVLSRSEVGDAIEDGIGFGGVQIGSKEAELLNRWGSTRVTPSAGDKIYQYSLNKSAFVLALATNGEVEAIFFLLNPYGAKPQLQTRRGIRLASSTEEVKRAYGDPEHQNGHEVVYSSQGVGFYFENNKFVGTILVFRPGRLKEFPTIR